MVLVQKINDFDAIFTSAMIDELVVLNQVISEDMKIINYIGDKLVVSESTILTYTTLNNST